MRDARARLVTIIDQEGGDNANDIGGKKYEIEP
jgi:hypothetical protein